MSEGAFVATSPRIGVALGGGAARGLAHIPYIEAMDELGLKPAIIAGTSIGALIGAGWASGMSGRDLREHALSVLDTMQVIAGRLWTTSLSRRRGVLAGVSMQVDAQTITEAFLPDRFPDDFAALKTPLRTVAADFHAWRRVVFEDGPLRPAIAASLAIPSLFQPVSFGGRMFIDGGVIDPVPVDCIAGEAELLVAVDVTGVPEEPAAPRYPSALDAGLRATQIMTQTLIRNALDRHPPDIYVQPQVNAFLPLEFWRVREIIAQTEVEKEGFKRALGARLEALRA